MQTNDDDVTLIFVFPSKGSYYMLDELLSFPRGNFAKLEKICLRFLGFFKYIKEKLVKF